MLDRLNDQGSFESDALVLSGVGRVPRGFKLGVGVRLELVDDPPRASVDLCATDRATTSIVRPSETAEFRKPSDGPRAGTGPAVLGYVCLLRSLSQESSYAGGSSPELERARPVRSGPPSWCRASARAAECWVSGTGVGAILGVPNVLGAVGRMSLTERKRHRRGE